MSAYFLEVIFNLYEKILASVKFSSLRKKMKREVTNIKHDAFNFRYYNFKNLLKV